MKLQQLPNGNWIDPVTITNIKSAERSVEFPSIKDRVIVEYRLVREDRYGGVGHANVEIINCESLEHAERLRDQLAELVNTWAELREDAR